MHFPGWLGPEEMVAHMSAADIAVFPSSQSVLWQQAIGCGLPLIAGDTGGQSPAYMNTHDNIVILPANEISAEGLSKEIDALIEDQERRAANGSRCTGGIARGARLRNACGQNPTGPQLGKSGRARRLSSLPAIAVSRPAFPARSAKVTMIARSRPWLSSEDGTSEDRNNTRTYT